MVGVRKVTDQEIIDLYKEIGNGNEVARRLRTNAVYRVLAEAGIARVGQSRNRRFQSQAEIDDVIRLYGEGETATSLGKKYGCSAEAVLDVLKAASVPIRLAKKRLSDDEKGEIRRLYETGMTMARVAEATGKHFNTVRILLNEKHPDIVRSKIVGPGGPHWKGGRTAHHGYAYVWIAPDDPMASMAHKSGYVAEHRLNMARKLGRPLRDTETVHHIDGDKSNNEPANLQLRQGRHGKHVVMCCLDCGSSNIGHTKLSDYRPPAE